MVDTLYFPKMMGVIASSVTAGPMEKNSAFASYFDEFLHEENNKKFSYEDLHRVLFDKSRHRALEKANLQAEEIGFAVGGDLINQMTPTTFAAVDHAIPMFPVFSACATSVQASVQAAIFGQHTDAPILMTTGSFHAAVERQFRYPIEYGSQKPATAQWTVTAGVSAIWGRVENGPYLSHATIGKVMDAKQMNPYDMGSAMAPAAIDTIERHLKGMNAVLSDYDAIITGDLGKYGVEIVKTILSDQTGVIRDAGALFYGKETFCHAGGSGAGCSAAVYFTHVLDNMQKDKWKRVLLVATGALLSPLTFQQGKTIPSIAHAMEWRVKS